MERDIAVRPFEVIGSPFCVASDDGQRVHDQIATAIKADQNVKVSFKNVKTMTSAFLNAAIGQLYGEFSDEVLKARLSVSDIEPDDLALLKKVVDTAKQYFKDPEKLKSAKKDILGE